MSKSRGVADTPFIRTCRPALVPELRLRLASDFVRLWDSCLADRTGWTDPPYWSVAWPGGQAVARYVLDHPHLVRNRRVLDVGCGSGVCAIAAAKAGARVVLAVDIDGSAIGAALENCELNGATIEAERADVLARPAPEDTVVLIGDMCYERDLSARVLSWVRSCPASTTVIVGDPGRPHFDGAGWQPVAEYDVPATADTEATAVTRGFVYAISREA